MGVRVPGRSSKVSFKMLMMSPPCLLKPPHGLGPYCMANFSWCTYMYKSMRTRLMERKLRKRRLRERRLKERRLSETRPGEHLRHILHKKVLCWIFDRGTHYTLLVIRALGRDRSEKGIKHTKRFPTRRSCSRLQNHHRDDPKSNRGAHDVATLEDS